MLNVNLALFKCHWGDEIGITNHGKFANEEDWNNTFLLIFEGKLPSIYYDIRDNSFEVKTEMLTVDYSDPSVIISQIKRGQEEAKNLLSELTSLINLPLNEKYEIISKNLSLILGEKQYDEL